MEKRKDLAHGLSCDTLFLPSAVKVQRSVSIFKWETLPSPKPTGGAEGDSASSLVYPYLFVGCLIFFFFFLPREKQKRLQREAREGERERLCLSRVV